MKTDRDTAHERPRVIGPGRKSSFSPADNCVELYRTTDPDVVAVRNSNDYGQGSLFVGRNVLGDLLAGIKAGELDDLI
jgi:Domain of unknown function (DUF397)